MTTRLAAIALVASMSIAAHAATITVEAGNNDATWTFATLGGPSGTDDAEGIAPTTIGALHSVSGAPSVLTDGAGQSNSGSTSESVFFNNGVSNGQVKIDLGSVIALGSIETYSWHFNDQLSVQEGKRHHSRAGQIYEVYGSTDDSTYTLIASVNTETAFGVPPYSNRNPQVGVGITGINASYRYLRFDVDELITEDSNNGVDGTNGTFYGEIDVYEIPEPSSLSLLGLGAAMMLKRRR